MKKTLPQYHWKFTPTLALVGAVLLACALFLIIPFTQLLGDFEKEIITYREVVTMQAPPPPAPPAPEVEPPQAEELPPPVFETPIEELTVNRLDLSLNPGIGDAIAMGVRTHAFETEVDAIGDIKKMFTFADLDEAPRVLATPRITFPRELVRRGIREGKVVLLVEIDEKGKARVLRVVSSTHPQLESVAKGIVKRALFTVPKVGGVADKVQGEWPVILQAPR